MIHCQVISVFLHYAEIVPYLFGEGSGGVLTLGLAFGGLPKTKGTFKGVVVKGFPKLGVSSCSL